MRRARKGSGRTQRCPRRPAPAKRQAKFLTKARLTGSLGKHLQMFGEGQYRADMKGEQKHLAKNSFEFSLKCSSLVIVVMPLFATEGVAEVVQTAKRTRPGSPLGDVFFASLGALREQEG